MARRSAVGLDPISRCMLFKTVPRAYSSTTGQIARISAVRDELIEPKLHVVAVCGAKTALVPKTFDE